MALVIFKLLVLMPVTLFFSLGALISIPFSPRGDLFRWFPREWCRFILWLFNVRVTVKGLEHVKPDESYVYVSNHASALDIPVVLVGIPDEVNIVFKRELGYVPVWGWALRWGPFIHIDRAKPRDAMKSLDRAADTIRNGSSVLLFAEGTRTLDGTLGSFKRGAFVMAMRAGKPILPVTINHTFRLLPKGSLLIRPAEVELVLDRPIDPTSYEGRPGEQELMDAVAAAIGRHYIDQSQEGR